MNCFLNYVPLRACSGMTESPSGLFLDDLPGISILSLDSIATASEGGSPELLWQRVQRRALKRLESDLLNRLYKKMRIKPIQSEEWVGQPKDPRRFTTPHSGYYRGVMVRLDGSRYMGLHLSEITLETRFSGLVNLVIIDAYRGEILKTIPWDVRPGQNRKVLEDDFFSFPSTDYIFIAADGGIQTASVSPYVSDKRNAWGFYDECACEQNYGDYSYVRGGRMLAGGTLTETEFQSESETYGISLKFQVRCLLQVYICSQRDQLISAWANLLGVELLREFRASGRVNAHTVGRGPDDLEERQKEYEGLYMTDMHTFVKHAKFPQDECFDCRTSTYQTFMSP